MRVKLALMLKPALAAKAKAKKAHGETAPGKTLRQKSDKALDVKREIAKAAGVSHDTVAKVEAVLRDGDDATKADMLAGKVSINKAAMLAGAESLSSAHVRSHL